jgi:hypothetical protein
VWAAAVGLVLAAGGFAALLTGAIHTTGDWQTVRERVPAPAAP